MPELLELIAEWASEHWDPETEDDDHPVVGAARRAAYEYREAVE
jgi:hypothetical protein